MNMEDFAREARRLSEADYSLYTEERVLIRELLKSAAELGEAILRKRNAPKEIPYDEIIKRYNDICSYKLPKVLRLSTSRKRHIKARFSDGYTIDDFERLFKMTVSSPFLCGENGRNWTANFDWLIEPGNMIKVLEGNYSARSSGDNAEHSYDLDMFDSFALNNTPKIGG